MQWSTLVSLFEQKQQQQQKKTVSFISVNLSVVFEISNTTLCWCHLGGSLPDQFPQKKQLYTTNTGRECFGSRWVGGLNSYSIQAAPAVLIVKNIHKLQIL